MFQIELQNIIQALKSNDNDAIQKADKFRNEILESKPEDFILTHFVVLSSLNDEPSIITILILLANLFHTMTIREIQISEESSHQFQYAILELFKNEGATENLLENISNLACKAEKYFQGNWTELPIFLISNLASPNFLISAISASCLSELIVKSIIVPNDFIPTIFEYIQVSLNMPEESIAPKIASILRLFYAIFPYFEKNVTETAFVIQKIPFIFPACQTDPSIAKDLSLFAETNSHFLFVETYQVFYECLLSIINNAECDLGVRNVCCYIFELLITNFPVQFSSNSILLFTFFTELYPQLEDTSLHLLSVISSLYGGDVEYAMKVYEFFQTNNTNPFSFAIFGSCFPGINDHFWYDEFVETSLQIFSEGFQNSDEHFRYFAFSNFLPLLQFLFDRKIDFDQNPFLDLFLTILKNETNEENVVEELNVLAKFIRFYGRQFREFLQPIFEVLDYYLNLCQSSFHIYKIISCYKYLALYFKEDILPFSENITLLLTKYFSDFQEYREAFFYCLRNIAFFALSIPNFDEICQTLFGIVFTQLYDSELNENPEVGLTEDERNSIILFIWKYIDNDLTVPPELVQNIVGLAFQYSNAPLEYEISDSPEDYMFSDSIMFRNSQNERVCVSMKQVNKIRKSLAIIHSILENFPELIPGNYQNLYDLILNQLNKCIILSIYPEIQPIELLILPLIPTFEVMNMLLFHNSMKLFRDMQTLDPDIVSLLLEFYSESIKIAGQKWADNPEFPRVIISFLLSFADTIDRVGRDRDAQQKLIGDLTFDIGVYDRMKIHVVLVLREIFRYFPIVSAEMIPFMMESFNNMINTSHSNIVFAVVALSDLLKLGPPNPELFAYLVEMCGSCLQDTSSQFVVASGIYGLSICMMPQYMDGEMLNQILQQILPLYSPDNKGNLYKHMIDFTLIQVILNYNGQIDVSDYFKNLWEIFAPNIIVHDYEVEFMAQSIFLLVTNFKEQIPPEIQPKVTLFIKNLLKNDLDEEIKAKLQSLILI